MRRIAKLLRSPRLSVWLVLGVTIYSLIATFIPQGGVQTPDTAAWVAAHPSMVPLVERLGLFSAFTTPVFLLLVALLTASTTACAWARTKSSVARWHSRGAVTDALVRQLKERPEFTITGRDVSLERASDALRELRLDVRQGPQIAQAVSGRLGLLGSPVFHWSLVVLFLAVSLGQLTRSEGQIGIRVGGSRPEAAESYGSLSVGPLFRGHSGFTLAVPRIQMRNVIDSIDREPAPEVILSDGETVLRDQLVYPNHPLRYGSYLVHRGPFGFSLPVSAETSTGQTADSLDLLIDLSESAKSGTVPQTIDLDSAGRSLEVTLTLMPKRSSAGIVRLGIEPAMRVRAEVSGSPTATILSAPGRLQLPTGEVMVLGSVANYARIGVVYDWSVWWIYGSLVTATLGLVLTMLMPYRVVWIMGIEGEETPQVNAVIVQARRDPIFASRVEHALRKLA
jgi:cytochrome c biogenesis protein ResB